MIEADRVLSTPPLNSSSIQADNPSLEARADSVDSFSRQPGTLQPDGQSYASDSPRPSGGNVLAFPGQGRRGRPSRGRKTGANIRTLCFRSYDLIVESDEAELHRDVCRDTRKAEVKLRKVKERLQTERERSTAMIELLSAAETRLSAAIVAALLSNRREG